MFGLAALALALHELALACMLALAACVRGPTPNMYTPALALHGLALVCMAKKYTPALSFNRLALVCFLPLVALDASLTGGPRAMWYSPAIALALVCMWALVCALGLSHPPTTNSGPSPNAMPRIGVALVVQQNNALLANYCHSKEAPTWCG